MNNHQPDRRAGCHIDGYDGSEFDTKMDDIFDPEVDILIPNPIKTRIDMPAILRLSDFDKAVEEELKSEAYERWRDEQYEARLARGDCDE